GMGSAFLDLTRDFGGAILQAIMGGLLATAYAASLTNAFAALPADQASKLSDNAADQITSSYAGAEQIAASYPQASASELMAAAAQAFTDGKSLAIGAALVLTVIGLLLVIIVFPRKARELAYYESIQQSA
ncbi:MAG: MFS transporter, partial [Candidatus Nanopelagicales bacterium]